jgi:(S)-2-hydroxyglutarate dehydrogenase
MSVYDFAIVGGGIVGLSTARALLRRKPAIRLLLLEKENCWAAHQTGHNSGVIHSGIYYRPGSLKATMAREGNRAMVRFCQEHGVPHEVCGKVIVAAEPGELPRLRDLFQRAEQNGLTARWLEAEALRDVEPHVRGVAAIQVPSTGIVAYRRVAEMLAGLLQERGVDLRLGERVDRIEETAQFVEVSGPAGSYRARALIACAGLQSDRLARRSGCDPNMKIVPFRGEYYRLQPARQGLVRNLIYPVPNPCFPFLGVHFTRMIDGSVEAGPNAVLSLKREGYTRTAFDLHDFLEVALYPGMWKLAARYWREGAEEVVRSFSKAAFLRSLQRLIPELRSQDLMPAPAGVRAQALRPNGDLVDDFHMISTARSVHVCNAPSPAATASFAIGESIRKRVRQEGLDRVAAA